MPSLRAVRPSPKEGYGTVLLFAILPQSLNLRFPLRTSIVASPTDDRRQCITLSVHLCLKHHWYDAARHARSSARAEICRCYLFFLFLRWPCPVLVWRPFVRPYVCLSRRHTHRVSLGDSMQRGQRIFSQPLDNIRRTTTLVLFLFHVID